LITKEVNRHLDKTTNSRVKTHNSDPATITFMKAAANIDTFKNYLTEKTSTPGYKPGNKGNKR
jgi:hypothetical protein